MRMTSDLFALSFDANDPLRLARFWSGLLHWELTADREDSVTVLPNDDTGFRLRFVAGQEKKGVPNRVHLDLTSASLEDQRETVARALALGARHIDIGQLPEDEHVVLADPEGNELCVIEPGNKFLADCGFIGAINCDGTQEVGYFWSEALGWPLVWDQNGETAIQSPRGGTKIAWGRAPGGSQDWEGPAALRSRPAHRAAGGGREAHLLRRNSNRHWPGRGRLGRAGRPRRERVLCVDCPIVGPRGEARHFVGGVAPASIAQWRQIVPMAMAM
jgi:predicted enzyme related to lactoylglutathione lyase